MNATFDARDFELSADEQIERDEAFMRAAYEQALLAQAAGEVPVGAVVVSKGEIVATGHNMRECAQDPAGHAELIALRSAAHTLQNWRLSECDIYVTLEPCLMCAGAMQQARIRRCVFGAYDTKGGALASLYHLGNDERLNHQFQVCGGILQEMCSELLSNFFQNKRL
ncbi:MAG: tRNA adenosine(34) deaminase TadA [Eggerthellaceae bacterium]|nr:tRNA adenosine(34) deaminase TadA [Eggerthellaceae bacterium]